MHDTDYIDPQTSAEQAPPELIDVALAQLALWLDKHEAAQRERAAKAAELAKIPADVPRFEVY